ncbi:hypothetical protein QQ054_06490 [Oscillatoria amoena NRMC-F 0135]|nr:hypothetical protein [Oscillatoria amoena NRMC-F 0135]
MSLRDATRSMIDECLPDSSVIHQRCRYVVEENSRLQRACDDLKNCDMISFGKKMIETHDGLSTLYEVSCPELDCLVNAVRNERGVYGARMMGGGFGGCTINLIKSDHVERVTQRVSRVYQQTTGKTLTIYPVKPGDGTSTDHR